MSDIILFTLNKGSTPPRSVSPIWHVLPPPFGRDWALLPSACSSRAELKALYAAVMQSFCLQSKAILARYALTRTIVSCSATSADMFVAPDDVFLPMSGEAEAESVSPVSAPAVQGSPCCAFRHLGALTCGGGATILALIAFGYLTQSATISDVKPAGKITVRQEAQAAHRLSPDAVVTNDIVALNRPAALPFGAAPSFVNTASESVSIPEKAAPSRAIAGHQVSHREEQRRGTPSQRARIGPISRTIVPTLLRSRLSLQVLRIAASNHKVHQVTTPAGTQLHNIAPPSDPALSGNPQLTGATEWIKHMSQRRVTEIPDQFAEEVAPEIRTGR